MTFTLGRDLGLVMAKGVVLGVLGCVTTLPSLILIVRQGRSTKTLHKPLIAECIDKLSRFIVGHKSLVSSCCHLHRADHRHRRSLRLPAHTSVYYDFSDKSAAAGYCPASVANEKCSRDEFDMGNTAHGC